MNERFSSVALRSVVHVVKLVTAFIGKMPGASTARSTSPAAKTAGKTATQTASVLGPKFYMPNTCRPGVGPGGAVDFAHPTGCKEYPNARAAKQGGYSNASIGGGLLGVGTAYGIKQSNDGKITMHSVSSGLSTPGANASITWGGGTLTKGCSTDVSLSLFFTINVSRDSYDGSWSWEGGIGAAGISVMQTCTW